MSSRCTICSNPQVGGIDADLAAGKSIRATASRFEVSRPSLARHSKHAQPAGASGPARSVGDQLAAAFGLLDRASSERGRLKALESIRSAVRLELKDHARSRSAIRSLTEEQLARLEGDVALAWEAFERVKDSSHDLADRALQGVRQAIDQLRSATARGQANDLIPVAFYMSGVDEPFTVWEVSAETILNSARIPKEYWTGHRVDVQLHFHGDPDVAVYDAEGKLMWRRAGEPGTPNGRLALPHEVGPGNGHKRDALIRGHSSDIRRPDPRVTDDGGS